MFQVIFLAVNLATQKKLLRYPQILQTTSGKLSCDRPGRFVLNASHLIIKLLYDVSSSQNIVTLIKNRERVSKEIRHARWFVIKQCGVRLVA